MSLKRAFDVATASVGMVVTSPFVLAGAFLSAVAHKSNPFFSQERVGLNGKAFKIYKIKSMHDGDRNVLTDDQRSSWVSKPLRKSRIDEIPQLYNVFIGDMSFVGPRAIMTNDPRATDDLRHKVKPGLVGLAQINGHNRLSDEARKAYDHQYVQNQLSNGQFKNLFEDITITCKGFITPFIHGVDP